MDYRTKSGKGWTQGPPSQDAIATIYHINVRPFILRLENIMLKTSFSFAVDVFQLDNTE